ncbi:hypothetical protein PoB_004191400 [Plakobranchus ocellatus]|uniref:Uncharacterized protein n=1 Tax=Plakobranchus ocellatus TaxID=259542 RepID=A0AAV4B5M9_9GAST|nr:hypothetical protein PoB_004191400 [Plakobranchus ocellatus]
MLLKLGVNVGAMSYKMCQAGDAQRQKDSARMSLDSIKKRRKILRAKRTGFQDITSPSRREMSILLGAIKLIEGLTDWLKAGKSLEAIEATKDRKKWRTMIANAVKQGT